MNNLTLAIACAALLYSQNSSAFSVNPRFDASSQANGYTSESNLQEERIIALAYSRIGNNGV